jgi:hypothetical protein
MVVKVKGPLHDLAVFSLPTFRVMVTATASSKTTDYPLDSKGITTHPNMDHSTMGHTYELLGNDSTARTIHQEEGGMELLISGLLSSKICTSRCNEDITKQQSIRIFRRTTRRWTVAILLPVLLLLLPMDGAIAGKPILRLKRKIFSRPVDDGPFSQIRIRYNRLTPNGKFAAGISAGFIGSRLAFATVTDLAKAGAVAFVA